MKKLVLILLTMILCLGLFVGCSSTPMQKQINQTWGDYEFYTYNVLDTKQSNVVVGAYTVKVERIDNETVTFGARTLENLIGTKITAVLTMINGDNFESLSVFNNKSIPKASYKKTNIKNENGELVTTTSYCEYTAKELEYVFNDVTTKINLPKHSKSPYYDNESIYQFIRSLPLSQKVSFPFKSKLWGENTLANLTVSSSNSVILKDIPILPGKEGEEKSGINAYIVSIARKLDFNATGVTIQAFYAKESINGIPTPLVKIVQDNLAYVLVSATTTK